MKGGTGRVLFVFSFLIVGVFALLCPPRYHLEETILSGLFLGLKVPPRPTVHFVFFYEDGVVTPPAGGITTGHLLSSF